MDLPPKSSRVVGSGMIKETLSEMPELFKAKERTGVITSILENKRVKISGLFRTIDGANYYAGKILRISDGRKLKILKEEGRNGSVVAEIDGEFNDGDSVTIKSHVLVRKSKGKD
jgi:hypothetical protein